MSNTPNNPLEPEQPKGPWLYSGGAQPTPAYVPPATTPATTPAASPSPSPAPSAVAPAAARPVESADKQQDDASLAGIIDTIEAIIIALILALTFRAFIVEAFVIPTGSMAPTLLGAHFNVTCPNCGYSYHRDASLNYQYYKGTIGLVGERGELTSNTNIPCDGDVTTPLQCPNCQFQIQYTDLPQYLRTEECVDNRARVRRPVPFAWANNGDRILVLKYIYSIMEPNRFDVIVFKEPMKAQDNFIKRLIGLPGETVEVINGDIYITDSGGDPANLEKRKIARKPAHLQKNLWQVIYDNDYYPQNEAKGDWKNPWRGVGVTEQSWYAPHQPGRPGTIGGSEIHYQADAPGALQFQQRDAYTFNILGYNNDMNDAIAQRNVPARDRNTFEVGDLHVETVWTPEAPAAAPWIALRAGLKRNLYSVQWSGTKLELRKFNLAKGSFEGVEADRVETVNAPVAGKSYHVEFNNVDHTIQFLIDGKMVLEKSIAWNAKDAHDEESELRQEPTAAGFEPEIAVEVSGRSTLGHLKLMRDLYYTQSEPNRPKTANSGNPLTLRADEFFAMGDNSRKSHDGRTWQTVFPSLDDLGTRPGVVPRRFLLGKAFFVYWPAGYRVTNGKIDVPLVPNTGDMRFIR